MHVVRVSARLCAPACVGQPDFQSLMFFSSFFWSLCTYLLQKCLLVRECIQQSQTRLTLLRNSRPGEYRSTATRTMVRCCSVKLWQRRSNNSTNLLGSIPWTSYHCCSRNYTFKVSMAYVDICDVDILLDF